MSKRIRHCLWSALLVATPAVAGQVTVHFVGSDRYTDSVLDYREPDAAMTAIGKHLARLGKRYLPAGEQLTVDVLDIDLAGKVQILPGRLHNPRVLTSVTWPSMKLRYQLQDGDRVVAGGEDVLRDMSYLDHINPYPRSDLFRYEKRMLDDWFRTSVRKVARAK